MTDEVSSSVARWHVVLHYRTDAGLLDDEAHFAEIADIHHWIERGPHFDTIVKVEITRVNPVYPALTLEQQTRL